MAKPIVIPIINTGSYSLDKQFKIEVTKVSDESGKSLLSEYTQCTVTIGNDSDSKEVMDKVMRLVNMDRQIYKLGTVNLGAAPLLTTRATHYPRHPRHQRHADANDHSHHPHHRNATCTIRTATCTIRSRARGLINFQTP